MAMSKKIIGLLLLAGGITVGLLLYRVLDPTFAPIYRCPLHWLTGWNCPGCGGQRALHALLQGHPIEALRYNMAAPLIVLYIVLAFVAGCSKPQSHVRRLVYNKYYHGICLSLFAVWTIARNIIGI